MDASAGDAALDPDPESAPVPEPASDPDLGNDPEFAAAAVPRLGSRTPPRAWLTWCAAVGVYFVAVFNRSSLGVAGLDAEHRFGINAAALSTFSMLQMLVYAGMQIPVGLLVDRLGPRRMLLAGLAVMCAAQACFAAVASFGLALLARGVLGCGDAMIFISVLRIVAAWFPARRVPLLTQLTSLTGAAGGIAAAWPLAWALRAIGWSGTFLLIAGLGAVVLVLPLGVVRDTPNGRGGSRADALGPGSPGAPGGMTGAGGTGDGWHRVREQMRAAWATPYTRLAVWIHFTTGFPAMVFSLLWGYPFLVQGEGLGSGAASALLTVLICVNMACCFAFGLLLTRYPGGRVKLAFAVIAVTALGLGAVLAWPGRAPLWLLVLLTFVYATNGAGSMIAFDVVRSDNPPERLGTAAGITNVGAFSACGITLLATGFLVDRTGAGHAGVSAAASLNGYKLAFCFPYLLLAIGTVQILRLSRIARASGHGATADDVGHGLIPAARH